MRDMIVIDKEKCNHMVYHVSSWTDSSIFPDLVSSSLTRDWFLNISLEARPEDDGVTEDDFNKVLEIFSRRQRVRPNADEMRVLTSIPGKTITQQHCRPLGRNKRKTQFPTLRSDQKCRIYVYSESQKPFLMDLFLKTEWILNVFGAAGIVMVITLLNRKRTHTLTIEKRFRSLRSTPLPDHLREVEGDSERGGPGLDSQEPLQDVIAPLVRHQILHTPVRFPIDATTNVNETGAEITKNDDLPPSYSLLDLELPHYNDINST